MSDSSSSTSSQKSGIAASLGRNTCKADFSYLMECLKEALDQTGNQRRLGDVDNYDLRAEVVLGVNRSVAFGKVKQVDLKDRIGDGNSYTAEAKYRLPGDIFWRNVAIKKESLVSILETLKDAHCRADVRDDLYL